MGGAQKVRIGILIRHEVANAALGPRHDVDGDGTDEVKVLHDALEPPLLELGCYRREERGYTPHITLGRVTNDADADELAALIAKQAEWSAGITYRTRGSMLE